MRCLEIFFSLVAYRHPHLAANRMSSRPYLPLERRHVHLLEKAVAECVVDLVEAADDRFGQLPLDEFVI